MSQRHEAGSVSLSPEEPLPSTSGAQDFAAVRSMKRQLLQEQRAGWESGRQVPVQDLLARWPADPDNDPTHVWYNGNTCCSPGDPRSGGFGTSGDVLVAFPNGGATNLPQLLSWMDGKEMNSTALRPLPSAAAVGSSASTLAQVW